MICLVFIRLDSTSGRVSVRVDANPRTGITGIYINLSASFSGTKRQNRFIMCHY